VGDTVNPLEVLARHPFFAGLSADALDAVTRRAVIRVYEKNALVYVEGEPAPGLYVVASGKVRVYKTSEDGREQDLFQASASESINEAPTFDAGPTMANAQATEPSVLLLMSRDALADLMRQHPQIGVAVLRVLSARLRELASLAGDLSLRDVISRTAAVLLRLAGQGSVAKTPSRAELATMVGTVREVATRALRHLESGGAIRLERGSVVIVDRARLEELSGHRRPAVS
jgi:CRP/FNR family transcriptional regulator